MADSLFTITVVHEVNFQSPAIAQAVLGAIQSLTSAQSAMENRIMGALEDLQARVDQVVAANNELLVQVREGNDKADALIAQNGALIVAATATKDALLAARDEIARLQATQGAATAEQLAAITAQLDAAAVAANQAIADANAQDAETDAATLAAGNAAGNVAP